MKYAAAVGLPTTSESFTFLERTIAMQDLDSADVRVKKPRSGRALNRRRRVKIQLSKLATGSRTKRVSWLLVLEVTFTRLFVEKNGKWRPAAGASVPVPPSK
jgi:hypothetical protein